MKTIAALFESLEDADDAVTALRALDIPAENLHAVARENVVEEELRVEGMTLEPEEEVHADEVAEGAGAGIVGGGVVGGLLGLMVGLGAITVPGIGAAFAAGSIGAAIAGAAGGAGVGAPVGAIIGAMLELSIPEDEAHVFAEGVRRGGILVIAESEEEMVEDVRQILDDANAMDVEALRERWEAEGWTGFEEEPAGDEVPDLT